MKRPRLLDEFISTSSEAHAAGLGVTVTSIMVFSWHYLPKYENIINFLWLFCVLVAFGINARKRFQDNSLDLPMPEASFVSDIRNEGHYFISFSGIVLILYVIVTSL